MTMNAIHKTVADLGDGRFILGLGVSHAHLVTKVRGHEYGRPVSTMRSYLEAMEGALYQGRQPKQEAPVVLAALRPRMLALAAEKTRGAHPYFVPPEHTARAREILGKGPWLCPEQMVLLETDPAKARAVARKNMAIYLGLRQPLQRCGALVTVTTLVLTQATQWAGLKVWWMTFAFTTIYYQKSRFSALWQARYGLTPGAPTPLTALYMQTHG
jgi:alkanesulfonate monooxygenase SsuD/methylene tetrahydromethanopterin reductase-like flavin-dependent oxidoreductase (luciferase family)